MENLSIILFLCALGLRGAFQSSTTIRKVWGPGEVLLEGPHWASNESALYFVDNEAHLVHRLDETGNVTSRIIDYGFVSMVVTVKDNPGLLLVCVRTQLFFLHWDSNDTDTSMRLLSAVDLGLPDNQCNDGKVDANGRLWIGTQSKTYDHDQASLYVISQSNYLHPEVKVRPVSLSNGIAWDADNKLMFYVDTPTRNVDVFHFDLATAVIRNRTTVFSFAKNNVTGKPDGMTIDSDGNLWVACYDGGKVIKIDPHSGKLLERHGMPASKVSSVMWGGPELDILYVTTGKWGLTEEEQAYQPDAGSLFAIEGTGCKGRPEHQFVFNNASRY